MLRLMQSIIQEIQRLTQAYIVALRVATKLLLLVDIRYHLKIIVSIVL